MAHPAPQNRRDYRRDAVCWRKSCQRACCKPIQDYVIPKQDADLWSTGAVLTAERLTNARASNGTKLCGCGCGSPLSIHAMPTQKYINDEHATKALYARQRAARADRRSTKACVAESHQL